MDWIGFLVNYWWAVLIGLIVLYFLLKGSGGRRDNYPVWPALQKQRKPQRPRAKAGVTVTFEADKAMIATGLLLAVILVLAPKVITATLGNGQMFVEAAVGFEDNSTRNVTIPIIPSWRAWYAPPAQWIGDSRGRSLKYVQLKAILGGDRSAPFKTQFKLEFVKSRTVFPKRCDTGWIDGFTYKNMQEWRSYGTRAHYVTPFVAKRASGGWWKLMIPGAAGEVSEVRRLPKPNSDLLNNYGTPVSGMTIEELFISKCSPSEGEEWYVKAYIRVVDQNGNELIKPTLIDTNKYDDALFWFKYKHGGSSSSVGQLVLTDVSYGYAFMVVPAQAFGMEGLLAINPLWFVAGGLFVLGVLLGMKPRRRRRR